MTVRITGSNRRPLGALEDVKATITSIFPGTEFITLKEPPSLGGGFVLALLGWMYRRRYPRCEGSFDNRIFAAEFDLGADAIVMTMDITLYGPRTTAAQPFIDKLADSTGWRVHFR